MDYNPLNQGVLTGKSAEFGPVTEEIVRARAQEQALITGRVSPDGPHTDYEQAKRELKGRADIDGQDTVLESIPESQRWDPVPGSTGCQAAESPSEDEDDEGRSATEQLFDGGVEAATRDRMLQAAQAAEKTDWREP